METGKTQTQAESTAKSPSGDVLTVTERAAKEIQNALGQQEESFAGVRLGLQGGGCCGPQYALAFARETSPEDVVIDAGNGVKILVNQADSETIQGAKIDFVETPMGAGFHIDNPSAKTEGHSHGQGHGHGGGGGCGCGGHGGGAKEGGCACGSGGCGC